MFATSRESVQVASGKLQTSWPTPPPHTEVARVARYVVHISGMTVFIHRESFRRPQYYTVQYIMSG